MSDQDTTVTTVEKTGSPRRRRFLAGLGAGGLAVATTMLGRAQASATVPVGCCNLVFNPTMSLSQCEQGTHYTWTCPNGPCGGCSCCEHGSPITASAAFCTRGFC